MIRFARLLDQLEQDLQREEGEDVASSARRYIPAPAASPMAATSQRLAAVVSPLTRIPERRITPPPRNPMPTTTFGPRSG